MSMSADELSLARLYLADPGTSAVQSIQIENASGGTFTVTFSGQTTAAVAYNAGANTLQNALCALSTVGVGNCVVNDSVGVPGSTFFTIYFTGNLANAAQPMVTVNSGSLTGTGVIVTVQQVTAGGATAFSDAELNALYDQAQSNFFLAISYAFRALQSNAAKFDDYVAGQTQEKKSQIYSHLEGLAKHYQDWAQAGQQVQIVRLASVPPRLRAVPVTSGVPATSLQYGPPYTPRRNWGGW
jgi:hypothetical protein